MPPPQSPPPLFRPFRALGYITDSVPFAAQRRGKETYVTVSVGRAWQVYNCAKLTLVLVGPQLHGQIQALSVKGDLTFAAVGGEIVECKRVHQVGRYTSGIPGPIIQLMTLGHVLLALSADGALAVWSIGDREAPQNVVMLPQGFRPSCMAHPDTYLNKVVIGSHGGQLVLVNFITGSCLYTFKGWGSAVRAVQPSPALDVVGVGLADGRAVLLNLKFDETLAVFVNAAGVGLASSQLLPGAAPVGPHATGGGATAGLGACTALTFRSGAGAPLLAAGGGAGVITVWDLEARRLHAVVSDAHDAPLVALHFFPGEPVLMSSGADNALKHWIFDAATPQPRLLRFRSGHAAPPTAVKHYSEGLRLLSAGSDRAFRLFSTIQDQQSRELSQKHTTRRAKKIKVRESELKLARVVSMDASAVRERDWANVITAHEGDATAYVWRLAHFTLGEHELRPPKPPKPPVTRPGARPASSMPAPMHGGDVGHPITAVAISACGNFGVTGSAGGRIDRYNMQSGQHRGVYARPDAAAATGRAQAPATAGRAAHDGGVTGLCVDSCNARLVSGALDGVLRVWNFKTQQLTYEVAVGCPITHVALAPGGSALVAVAGADLTLRCYDVEAEGRLVRRFVGHRDRITCLQLSADGRWLLSSSMDGSLRVWDVPAARCLQVLRLGAPVTSFSLPPAQDLLATCHVNRRGIYLWSNQAVFGNPADFTHSERPVNVALPSIAAGHDGASTAAALEGRDGEQPAGAARIAGQSPSQQRDEPSTDDEPTIAGGATALDRADEMSEEDEGYSEREEEAEQAGADPAGVEGDSLTPAWEVVDGATGGPAPLCPSLVTLSLLPRSQWHSLLHLDTIKARNRPIEPPKKPEAAPFFLPTVAGLSRQPVFDTSAQPAQPEEGGGGGETAALPAADAAARDALSNAPAGSRVHRVQGGKDGPGGGVADAEGTGHGLSRFVALLRACADAGDWTSFVAHLRTLSPAALDREVRALQLLAVGEEGVEGAMADAAVQDLGSLLDAVDAQLQAGTNFEFATALLQLVLTVHGDAVAAHPLLRGAADRVRRRLAPIWARLDTLLGDVSCMTAFFANLQG